MIRVTSAATAVPANEAAAHVGESATVAGIVAKVFTSNKGQHVFEYRCRSSQSNLHRLDTACITGLQIADSVRH